MIIPHDNHGFQSTLPLRGATKGGEYLDGKTKISIHAPLTGSDTVVVADSWMQPISIHAPLTGSDISYHYRDCQPSHFNPRSPYGERHIILAAKHDAEVFQSTLPLRGATPPVKCRKVSNFISIHAPLTGSDNLDLMMECIGQISIHAPLTGSDQGADLIRCRRNDFNPRSPYGERRPRSSMALQTGKFQSTLPLRGATLEQAIQESEDA